MFPQGANYVTGKYSAALKSSLVFWVFFFSFLIRCCQGISRLLGQVDPEAAPQVGSPEDHSTTKPRVQGSYILTSFLRH